MKCNDCGVPLDKVDYLEPDVSGRLPYDPKYRPPLCHECWKKKAKVALAKIGGKT